MLGLVVSTTADPISCMANFIWCGSKTAQGFITKGRKPLEGILADFDTGVR